MAIGHTIMAIDMTVHVTICMAIHMAVNLAIRIAINMTVLPVKNIRIKSDNINTERKKINITAHPYGTIVA